MKKERVYAIVAVLVLASIISIAGIAAVTGNSTSLPKQANSAGSGTVKQFSLTFANGDYQPNPIIVNKGDTVRLVADMSSIYGCYRAIVIPAFGVRKVVSQSDNVVEFTASKAGTFQMTCSMGMAGGSIVVMENGKVPASPPASNDVISGSGQSCGTGGCGCA